MKVLNEEFKMCGKRYKVVSLHDGGKFGAVRWIKSRGEWSKRAIACYQNGAD